MVCADLKHNILWFLRFEIMQNENSLIVKQNKTYREAVTDLVDLVFQAISKETGANVIMLKPALNIGKMKLSQMTEEEARNLVMQVHFISRSLEKETGEFSPYHGIEDLEP